MKKLVAILMVASMMLSMSVGASAVKLIKHSKNSPSAAQRVEGYGIKVSEKNMTLSQDGKDLSTRAMKTSKITLSNSKDGGVAVQFSADSGKFTKIALGNDTKVIINGSLDSLTIKSSLDPQTVITIGQSAKIGQLKVEFKGKVMIDGSVNQLEITNKDASVTASDKASVGKVSAVAKSSFIGKSKGAVSSATPKEPTSPSTAPNNTETKNAETSNLNKSLNVTEIQETIDGLTFRCEVAGADVIINGKHYGSTSKGKNTVYVDNKDPITDITIQKDGYTPVTLGVVGYYTDKELQAGDIKLFA